MPRALLIHNPAAARTKSGALESIRRVFTADGWKLEMAATTRPDHAAELAHQGVEADVAVIAVYGGDGTMIHAVEGMVGGKTPLGLIPGGTGNLLAGNLRLPRSPTRAARVITRGVPRAIDLGRLTCGGTVRHFAVACGAGLDAEVMAGTSGAAKRRWGMAAYVAKVWEAILEIRPQTFRVTVDGQSFEIDAASVLVANCGEIVPPFLRLREGIAVDDGVLDLVALNARNVVESAGVFWELVTGRGNGTGRIWHARGRSMRVEGDSPRPVQLDGEAAGVLPFTVDVVPGGIQVCLPASSPA